MKKTYKKAAAFALILVMIFTGAGCGKKNAATGSDAVKDGTATVQKAAGSTGTEGDALPGWQKNAADKVDLTWYINFSWFTTPWGENLVSKTITEKRAVM